MERSQETEEDPVVVLLKQTGLVVADENGQLFSVLEEGWREGVR